MNNVALKYYNSTYSFFGWVVLCQNKQNPTYGELQEQKEKSFIFIPQMFWYCVTLHFDYFDKFCANYLVVINSWQKSDSISVYNHRWIIIYLLCYQPVIPAKSQVEWLSKRSEPLSGHVLQWKRWRTTCPISAQWSKRNQKQHLLLLLKLLSWFGNKIITVKFMTWENTSLCHNLLPFAKW